MTGRRRSLRSCQRGAMYVEALVMIPLLVVLWIIVVFLEQGNTVDNDVVEDARYCAWRYAVNRCEGGAPRCSISGPSELLGVELDGRSGGALTTLTSATPYLADQWLRPHGGVFHASSEGELSRPFGWSAVRVRSDQTWMCQTPASVWTTPMVFLATCQYYGLAYCSLFQTSLPTAGEVQLPAGQTIEDVNPARARTRFLRWKARRVQGNGVAL